MLYDRLHIKHHDGRPFPLPLGKDLHTPSSLATMIVNPIAPVAGLLLSSTTPTSLTQLHQQSCEKHENMDSQRRKCVSGGFAVVTTSAAFLAGPCNALSPDEASVAYDLYAKNYDDLDGGSASSALGLDDARVALFGKAKGKVLEIGVGTGLNLAKYDKNRVTSLTVVDISEGMIQEAKEKTKSLDIPVEFVRADATMEIQKLFGGDSFDTVVDSFSLCVMGNKGARQCLMQMQSVVKPDGRILLLENSRSSSSVLGWYQDVTANAAASAGGKGCVYNQDVGAMIQETSGLTIENEEAYVMGLFRSFQVRKG